MQVRSLTPAPVVVLGLCGIGVAAYLVAPGLGDGSAVALAIGGVAVAAALAGLLAVVRAGQRDPVAWALQVVALVALVVADAATWAESLDLAGVADASFLVGAAALIAAVTLRRQQLQTGTDRCGALDTGMFLVPVALFATVALLQPARELPSPSLLVELAAVAHPLVDVLLVGVALRLVLATSDRSPAVALTAAGVVALASADAIQQMAVGPGTVAGSTQDEASRIIFLFAYALLGAAAAHPGSADRLAPPDAGLITSSTRIGVLAVAASISPMVLVASVEWPGVPDEGLTRAAGLATVVTWGIALARASLVVRSVRDRAAQAGAAGLSALVEHSTDVIAVIDGEGMVRYLSPAFSAALGRDPDRFVGSAFRLLAHPDDVGPLTTQLHRIASGPRHSTSHFEVRLVASNSAVHTFEATASNMLGEDAVDGVALTLRDVTDRMALAAELTHQAFHDSLTGLANRGLFADRVDDALHRRRRNPWCSVAVMFIDLDDFKAVNDGVGHGAGDALLRSVGQRIVACLRAGDTAARLGGDEFAVLVEDDRSPGEVLTIAARILDALREPMSVGGMELTAAASVGMTVAGEDSSTIGLLRDADIAMDEAKRSGKGRAVVFDPSMGDLASARLALQTDLATALERGELRVVYQPIVSLATGLVDGAEALVRWDHPTRGRVMPDDFIPAAEQTGLIVPMGAWVMAEACRRAATNGARVGVNVSGVQFASPDLLDHIERALIDSGLPPSQLTVEITETALMLDTAATAALLDQLREAGVRIAIDDFGTGYCSLAYLQRFAVDVVKIDRTFVAELDQPSKGSRLARTIMQMADSLEVTTVVAEGIETDAQLERLMALGCRYGQGYLLSPPLERADYDALLAGQRSDAPR